MEKVRTKCAVFDVFFRFVILIAAVIGASYLREARGLESPRTLLSRSLVHPRSLALRPDTALLPRSIFWPAMHLSAARVDTARPPSRLSG